ncbi:MAG: hypothetical protein ACOWWO_15510 [Peptococcaceae bacterium]
MVSSKKILTMALILFILLSLFGCAKIIEVKRIGNDTGAESSVDDEEANSVPEQGGQELNTGIFPPEQAAKPETEGQSGPAEDESPQNSSKAVLQDDASRDSGPEGEEVKEAAGAGKVKAGVISYLFLTGTYQDELPGLYQDQYLVGKDHFVHLGAGLYDSLKDTAVIEIGWWDYQEKTIYKEERVEVKSQDKIFKIHATLGLTKKVPGQDKIPDALGDYWVIIQKDNEVLSKTRFSIVAE